jgi:hypothetical protein
VRVALILSLEDATPDLDAYLSYHRAAGIDVVAVAAPAPATPELTEILERHAAAGFVHHAAATTASELARVAVDEFGAEWVVPGSVDEVWWPRGESLGEVLAVIPPRYGVVQGLVRTFVDGSGSDGASRFDSRIVRTSLLGPDGSGGAPLADLLRPIYRAGPNMALDPSDWTLGGRRIPLRAWYPVEVFSYPHGADVDQRELEARLAEGSLAVDTRLRDALAASGAATFVVPGIVDDASYAVECAAVGEVDLVRLDRQIRELELRIAGLEARFWPSMRRTLRGLVPRRR